MKIILSILSFSVIALESVLKIDLGGVENVGQMDRRTSPRLAKKEPITEDVAEAALGLLKLKHTKTHKMTLRSLKPKLTRVIECRSSSRLSLVKLLR